MIRLPLTKKGAFLAAVVGSMLLTAYPGRAQTPEIQAELSNLLQGRRHDLISSELIASAILAPESEMLGATLQPLGDALRAQLGVPAGQGLVVENLRAEGASAQAGLQQNDVLLALADKPLATTDDLIKQLKAAGESPVALKLLRAGKPVTIQVRPIYRVTLGPVGEQKTEYYIGISVAGPNDATRAQLGLPDDHGMVITDVEAGSAAEKAGVKKYDIVLEVDGKPIGCGEALTSQIQATNGQPARLQILRRGNSMTLTVTPAMRKVEASRNPRADLILFLNKERVPPELHQVTRIAPWVRLNRQQPPADGDELRQRLDQLEKELNAVRTALDRLNETLKANKGNKPE